MKKYIFQTISILALVLFSVGSFAQDKRTLETKVVDVLAQMPTRNLTHLNKAMNEVFEMGPEGFQKLTEQLTAPGEGDDTAVRFAINSFARYASQFGKPKAKAFAEDNLLKALQAHENDEVKTFILNQLNLVGGENTLHAAKSYLANRKLVEPATQTILAIGNPASAKLFIEAFPKAENNAKITLVRALGKLKSKDAIAIITPLAKSKSVAMQKTALTALANIGSPESYKTLQKAASAVKFKYNANNATGAFLEYANRLGEENELKTLKKACKAIIKANRGSNQLHNYSSALAIYSKYMGHEATPMLLKTINNPNKAFRYSVLNTAEKIGGIADTRKWIARAETASPAIKADIISMLGRRGSTLANNLLYKNLNSTNENVRRESIIALGKLQAEKAVPILLRHLANGKDLETTKATLNQLLDKNHLTPIAQKLNKTSGKTKAALIDLVAAKAGVQYFDKILANTTSSDSDEKAAAFRALKNVTNYKDTDDLLRLLFSISDKKEISEVQMALTNAIKGVAEEQKEGGKILTALKTTNKKERILPILPEVGGDLALKTITKIFHSSSDTLKEASFKALSNWKDYSAAEPLYQICKSSKDSYTAKAALSFSKMINAAKLTDDQKLLQFRKIIQFVNSDKDKNYIISSIGGLKTFLSIVYLEPFLDDKASQQDAAYAIKNIILGGKFYGKVVRRVLEKIVTIMDGEDSQYDKINVKKYLDEMPEGKGFLSMFNGKNLEGWQGMIAEGNPIAIAKLSEEERNEAQKEANQKMLENWSVKDGKIVFNGHGANLVSVKKYKDFEMIVDWRITKKGDSGIYLRGTPQVQIWDTSRVEVGAQVGSGGLYNNNKDNIRNPLKVADNPVNEWNTFRITMIGENVTVYLNGELVVNNVKMDNYWNREIPIFESGTIELQAHGNELAFRDVYVREINTMQIGLTQEEINNGFVSLFNGKNLNGWQGNKTDYYAKNGELVVDPKMGGHGNLFTEKQYSDFIYRFEFKLSPAANNGLGIRAPLLGDAAYEGIELQILDNTAPIYAKLKDYQYHGSAYGIIAAKRGFLNPTGEWNSQEVIVKGTKIKVTLNNNVILDGDITNARKNGTIDGKNHPGLYRNKGHIGFLGHGSTLYFRNIRIKDLSK